MNFNKNLHKYILYLGDELIRFSRSCGQRSRSCVSAGILISCVRRSSLFFYIEVVVVGEWSGGECTGREYPYSRCGSWPEPMHGRTALRNGCCQHSPSPLQHPCRKPDADAHSTCHTSTCVGRQFGMCSWAYCANTDVISEVNKQRLTQSQIRGSRGGPATPFPPNHIGFQCLRPTLYFS